MDITMNTKTLWIGIGLTICACSEDKPQSSFVEENTEHARRQIGGEINAIEASGKFRNPVHVKKNGETFHCDYGDWRSGFFPGSVWYLYELSGDTTLLPIARKYTETLKEVQNITWSHDVGFMVGCSFGNGLRLTGDTAYASVIQQTAKSLCTRYRPSARVIQSWNVDRDRKSVV